MADEEAKAKDAEDEAKEFGWLVDGWRRTRGRRRMTRMMRRRRMGEMLRFHISRWRTRRRRRRGLHWRILVRPSEVAKEALVWASVAQAPTSARHALVSPTSLTPRPCCPCHLR